MSMKLFEKNLRQELLQFTPDSLKYVLAPKGFQEKTTNLYRGSFIEISPLNSGHPFHESRGTITWEGDSNFLLCSFSISLGEERTLSHENLVSPDFKCKMCERGKIKTPCAFPSWLSIKEVEKTGKTHSLATISSAKPWQVDVFITNCG